MADQGRQRPEPRPTSSGGALRDDAATTEGPLCRREFIASGRSRFCSDSCRKIAWRRRNQPGRAPLVVPPPGVARRLITVYECDGCGDRAVGDQYCEACSTFMRRVGVGGSCPHCDGAVAVTDLVAGAVVDTPTRVQPTRSRTDPPRSSVTTTTKAPSGATKAATRSRRR